MGQITIDTPQGPKTGIIAGDTPTEQEINQIKELYPSSEGESFNYKVITASPSSQPRTENPDEVRIRKQETTTEESQEDVKKKDQPPVIPKSKEDKKT